MRPTLPMYSMHVNRIDVEPGLTGELVETKSSPHHYTPGTLDLTWLVNLTHMLNSWLPG